MSYGGTSLPNLVPNGGYFSGESKEGDINAFDKSADDMTRISFTAADPTISIKERITRLEMTAASQSEYNLLTHETLHNSNTNLLTTENQLTEFIVKTQKAISNTIAELKAEYDHKFDLQSTENKRLQNTVASLKADSIQTKRKLVSIFNYL